MRRGRPGSELHVRSPSGPPNWSRRCRPSAFHRRVRGYTWRVLCAESLAARRIRNCAPWRSRRRKWNSQDRREDRGPLCQHRENFLRTGSWRSGRGPRSSGLHSHARTTSSASPKPGHVRRRPCLPIERGAFHSRSGSSNPADSATLMKCFKFPTATQFTIRVITNSVTTACGLNSYRILGRHNCPIWVH